MRDEKFIRGRVPMTKSEVRAVSLSKLELRQDCVVYDIGAGTGSVSVEAALAVPKGRVYAIEQKQEALELLEANKEKFGTGNLVIVAGKAPGVMDQLPAPDHAFIGGTSGEMEAVIRLLYEKNPQVRIVINIIALETLAQVMGILKKMEIEAEIVSVQIAKAKTVGGYHLMQGQNPVYVIAFGGTEG